MCCSLLCDLLCLFSVVMRVLLLLRMVGAVLFCVRCVVWYGVACGVSVSSCWVVGVLCVV